MSLNESSNARIFFGGLVALMALPFASATQGTDPDVNAARFTDTSVFEGIYYANDYDSDQPHSKPLERGPYGELENYTVTLSSNLDGADIQVAILRPNTTRTSGAGQPADHGRVPVIAFASVYLPDFSRANFNYAFGFEGKWARQAFLPHGYALAFIPVRGTGGSGGCYDTLGPKEIADIDQAVTWLGEQEWSNGAVGMLGLSYNAFAQWGVAAMGNPHLRTIIVAEGTPSVPTIGIRNGTAIQGAPAAPAYFRSYSFIHAVGFALGAHNEAWIRTPENVVEGMECPESAVPILGAAEFEATGEYDSLGFSSSRDFRSRILENYHGSVLLLQGLRDPVVSARTVWPWVDELDGRDVPVKQIIGQWEHRWPDTGAHDPALPDNGTADLLLNPTPRWDLAEITLHWLDRWLKDERDTDLGPRVQVADQSGQWRNEESWPPHDSSSFDFHLAGDGTLAATGGSASQRALLPGPAPADASRNEACLICAEFSTEPLSSPLRFAGSPTVHLEVIPLGPSGQLSGDLFVEHSGSRKHVGRGTIDLAHARGDGTRNAVIPGTPIPVRLELDPMDVVVPTGDRLVLSIHAGPTGSLARGGEFRFYYASPVPSGPLLAAVGGDSSILRLPTIERAEEDFFEAPPLHARETGTGAG